MPWRESKIMDLRKEMIEAHASGWTVTDLAAHCDVSRKTIYKWLKRYDPADPGSLDNHSRAPAHCSHRTPEIVRDALVELRLQHPHWGPRKLLAVLGRRRADMSALLPAPSTAGAILKQANLVTTRRRRERSEHPGTMPLVADAPNSVWCADYKGKFKTGNERWCYPLTMTDAYSRLILICDGHEHPATAAAMASMERLFREVGLPKAIRTDNGEPFASPSRCGLSTLSAWWTKLGIEHQRTRPASPQDNPRHERMHRDLKQETARPPAWNMERQQERFDAFIGEFNHERPHEAIDMQTPASLWTPPTRAMPDELPEPEYPGHMQVRSVRHDGCVKFQGHMMFLSTVLAHERVAFEEIEDAVWAIFFFGICVGR